MDTITNSITQKVAIAPEKTSFMAQFYGYIPNQIKSFFHSLSKEMLSMMGIYLVAGFFVGFVIKKCTRICIIILLFLAALAALQHFGYIVIMYDMTKIQTMLGMKAGNFVNAPSASTCFEWIRLNKAIAISGITGFLVGLKLG